MKKNLGYSDRILRLLIVALICSVYFTDLIGGLVAQLFIIAAGYIFFTSLTGWSLFYAILGINTHPKKKIASY